MQRSQYSFSYLSNGNNLRPFTSDSYSPQRNQNSSYSSSFIRELEKHHERSLQIANDRIKTAKQEIKTEKPKISNIKALLSDTLTKNYIEKIKVQIF